MAANDGRVTHPPFCVSPRLGKGWGSTEFGCEADEAGYAVKF